MSQDDSSTFLDASAYASSRRYRAGYELVLDYALGAAIIGLNPLPNLFILTLIFTSILLLKMRQDIKKMWNVSRRRGFWASTDILLGGIGALSIAFMAWLTLIIASAFIPIVHRFAVSASLFALVWMVGFVINHSYLKACATQAGEESNHG